MARMSEIEWEPCLLSQRPAPELERRFARETGRPGKMMRYFEGSKWLGDVIVRVSVQLMTFVHVDPDLVDQAGLIVAQDNSCRFCFGVQRANGGLELVGSQSVFGQNAVQQLNPQVDLATVPTISILPSVRSWL